MFCHFERRKNGKSTRGIELEKWSVPPFFGPRSGIGHARKFFPVFDAHCAYRHVLQIGTSVHRSHMRSGDNFTQFVRHITIPFISFSALWTLFSTHLPPCLQLNFSHGCFVRLSFSCPPAIEFRCRPWSALEHRPVPNPFISSPETVSAGPGTLKFEKIVLYEIKLRLHCGEIQWVYGFAGAVTTMAVGQTEMGPSE